MPARTFLSAHTDDPDATNWNATQPTVETHKPPHSAADATDFWNLSVDAPPMNPVRGSSNRPRTPPSQAACGVAAVAMVASASWACAAGAPPGEDAGAAGLLRLSSMAATMAACGQVHAMAAFAERNTCRRVRHLPVILVWAEWAWLGWGLVAGQRDRGCAGASSVPTGAHHTSPRSTHMCMCTVHGARCRPSRLRRHRSSAREFVKG